MPQRPHMSHIEAAGHATGVTKLQRPQRSQRSQRSQRPPTGVTEATPAEALSFSQRPMNEKGCGLHDSTLVDSKNNPVGILSIQFWNRVTPFHHFKIGPGHVIL